MTFSKKKNVITSEFIKQDVKAKIIKQILNLPSKQFIISPQTSKHGISLSNM